MAETDPRLLGDALWVALDELLVHLKDEPQRCLINSELGWDGGLNAAKINRLVIECGLSDSPIIWQEGESGEGSNVYRFIAHPVRPPIKWHAWSPFPDKLWPYPSKLGQTIGAVEAWREKWVGMLRGGGREKPPLTHSQQEAYDLIRNEGPLFGKEVVRRLAIGSESAFTSHYVPALKARGIVNRRGLGYYHPDKYKPAD